MTVDSFPGDPPLRFAQTIFSYMHTVPEEEHCATTGTMNIQVVFEKKTCCLEVKNKLVVFGRLNTMSFFNVDTMQLLGGEKQTGGFWTFEYYQSFFNVDTIHYVWVKITQIGFGMVHQSLSGYTFLETVCVYGYSLFIYIPTSISWTISVYWLEWLLIVIAMVISGSVLVMTFWPAICDDTKLTAFATMAVIVSLHALLAVGFKLYFFQTPTYTGSSHSGQQTTPAANHTTLTVGKHQ
ncbi:protein YIPF1-like [Sinocyclocheilus grahami]|uniref:protein YIPF1-like n=1 Tax=Sinocyclocheilus grahami TaxID=75366 RepID=UPI0007AC875F|nr:PREDICTED: protein YIPF1-like [Sinocyclocheilus grahami]